MNSSPLVRFTRIHPAALGAAPVARSAGGPTCGPKWVLIHAERCERACRTTEGSAETKTCAASRSGLLGHSMGGLAAAGNAAASAAEYGFGAYVGAKGVPGPQFIGTF